MGGVPHGVCDGRLEPGDAPASTRFRHRSAKPGGCVHDDWTARHASESLPFHASPRLRKNCGGLRYFEIAESMYPQIANDLPADLHLGFVYGNAVFKQDLAAAQLWWQRMEAKGKTRYKLDYWKARAALRWIEGDRSEAREAWRKADSWARQAPATGAYDFDRDEIARLGVLLDAAETTEPLVTPVL